MKQCLQSDTLTTDVLPTPTSASTFTMVFLWRDGIITGLNRINKKLEE